jgi:hypothetical protein
MIVNLPKMLHEALLRGQTGSKKAMEHARAVSAKAKTSGSISDNSIAILAMQRATETQGAYAATVAHVMASIASTQNPGGPGDDYEQCTDESCPIHGGEKPN